MLNPPNVVMWLKQYHKPPMTGNGKFIPPINLLWWLGDGADGILYPHWLTMIVISWLDNHSDSLSFFILNVLLYLSGEWMLIPLLNGINGYKWWYPKIDASEWKVPIYNGWWLGIPPFQESFKWRFPKTGVPPNNHPFLDGDFQWNQQSTSSMAIFNRKLLVYQMVIW